MAERSAVFQLVQIGVEATPGTQVAATKRLTSAQFTLGMSPSIDFYRASGHLFDTLSALNQEMVEGSYDGGLTYTEIVYYLSSVIGSITPPVENQDDVTPTGSYTWVFSPNLTSANTPKTFTIEQGESASRFHNVTYALLTGMTISISRDGCTISGDLVSKALIDQGGGAVFTALTAADAVPLIPVLPTQVFVYMGDAQADLATATALTRVKSLEWQFTDRWAPLFVLNGSSTFISHLAQVPKMQMTIMQEADAEGMALIGNMRNGATKFVRVKATGANIYTGTDTFDYTFQLDLAAQVEDVSDFGEEDGLTTIEWTLHGVEDATWGKAVEVSITNEIATL